MELKAAQSLFRILSRLIMTQHCRISLEDAIEDYAAGLLTAKGAIAYWVRIHLAPGWKRKINPKEIRETFRRNNRPMARSTFWDALHSLDEAGLIQFDEPGELEITRIESGNDNPSEKPDVSEKPDARPKNRTGVRKTGRTSEIPNERPPEPAQGNGSTESPDSYQIYSDLDQREREGGEFFSENSEPNKWETLRSEFEEWRSQLSLDQQDQFGRFALEKLRSLPQQPAIPDKWILSNWKFLRRQFEGKLLTHDRTITVEASSASPSPQKTSPSDVPPSPNQVPTPSPYKSPAQLRAEAEAIDRENRTPEGMAAARQALDAIHQRFGLRR